MAKIVVRTTENNNQHQTLLAILLTSKETTYLPCLATRPLLCFTFPHIHTELQHKKMARKSKQAGSGHMPLTQ
jgi:hypothetical protein